MMDDFERTLSRLHTLGKKRFGEDWIRRLKQRRVRLEQSYASLFETDRDPISYSSLSARTAYVFAYAPARAEYTRQFLARHRIAWGKPLFDAEAIEVVSFGGGPASELLGLVRYLEEPANGENVAAISYVVYDKDGAWADTAACVVENLETEIEIDMRYEEVDAASRIRMREIDLSNTDLVIFSYIMSELAEVGQRDQIAENFREVLGSLSVGAKILFIDNLYTPFIKYFQSCKLVAGLNQKNDDGEPVNCEFPPYQGTFDLLSEALVWNPRTELRSVSKLIVRTNL